MDATQLFQAMSDTTQQTMHYTQIDPNPGPVALFFALIGACICLAWFLKTFYNFYSATRGIR